MVGQDGFNKSNGPTVFVVNDCNALTGALNAVWPDSGHLINTTYALQVCGLNIQYVDYP